MDKTAHDEAEALYWETRVYPTRANFAALLRKLCEIGDVGLLHKYADAVRFAHWIVNGLKCLECTCEICKLPK